MAKINANKLFSAIKNNTTPVFAVPKSTKEVLQISEVFKDGIFRVEPQGENSLYDRCYIFEDINYVLKDDPDKVTTLEQLMSWLKSMTVEHKIIVASEQINMDEFISDIYQPVNRKQYPDFDEGFGAFIYQKVNEGSKDINKTMFLVTTCRANSYEQAKQYFNTIDTGLEIVFSMLGSNLYRMGAVERLVLLQRMINLNQQSFEPQGGDIDEFETWRRKIAPSSIKQEKDHLIIENKYCCLMYAYDYSTTLNDEKVINSLIDNTFPVYATLIYEPVPKVVLNDILEINHTNTEVKMAKERQRNNRKGQYGVDASYMTTKKLSEIEDLMDKADENDESCLFVAFYVMTYADTFDELVENTDTLTMIANGLGFTLKPSPYKQLKTLMSLMPTGGHQTNEMIPLLSSSAVAFNPFYACDLKDDGGFIYGLNQTTKQLIRGNRKKLKNPHGMICGHTGGGKSALMKMTEIIQGLLCTKDDIVVIDPKNETEAIIKAAGGSYYDLTPQCDIHLNPFEVPEKVWAGDSVEHNKFCASKCDFANAFIAAAMTNITFTINHSNKVYKAVQSMYGDYFAAGDYYAQPTLTRLYERYLLGMLDSCREDEKQCLHEIIDTLEIYVSGIYNMFAFESNIRMDNRLIGFGLWSIPNALWEVVMITIMNFLAQKIEYNQSDLVAARAIFDETQFLCHKGTSAQQLLAAVETYRSKGAIVTLIIQNLARALQNPDLRDMFSNCAYKCFLDQGGVDAQAFSEIQELSEVEFKALAGDEPGYGVMVWDKQIFLFDFHIDKNNPLFDLINTDFHDMAERSKDTGEQDG